MIDNSLVRLYGVVKDIEGRLSITDIWK